MMKRSWGFAAVLAVLVLSLSSHVFASEVMFSDLQNALANTKLVIKGKLDSVKVKAVPGEEGLQHFTGNPKTEYYYTITVEKVLRGQLKGAKIQGKYTFLSPDYYTNGEITIRSSIQYPSSGIEGHLEKGVSYLFLFSADQKDAQGDYEVLRVDTADKEKELPQA